MSETILPARRMFAFLQPVGARERSLGRLILFLVLAIPLGALASLIAVLAVAAVAAGLMEPTMAQLLGGLAGGTGEDRPLLSYGFEFAVAGFTLFAMAAVWIALAARIYGRPMGSFITAAPRFRWRMVGLGLAVAAPIIAVALVVELTLGDTPVDPPLLSAAWPQAAGYAAIATVCLFLAALAEEMVFRGWLLQQTAAFTRRIWVLLVVNGALFSLIHFDPDPGAFAVRMGMGMAWAWIALRLGGLEFATGAHLANNLAVTLFVEPLTLTPAVGEAAEPRTVLLQLAIVVVTVAVVEFALRRNKRGRIAAPR